MALIQNAPPPALQVNRPPVPVPVPGQYNVRNPIVAAQPGLSQQTWAQLYNVHPQFAAAYVRQALLNAVPPGVNIKTTEFNKLVGRKQMYNFNHCLIAIFRNQKVGLGMPFMVSTRPTNGVLPVSPLVGAIDDLFYVPAYIPTPVNGFNIPACISPNMAVTKDLAFATHHWTALEAIIHETFRQAVWINDGFEVKVNANRNIPQNSAVYNAAAGASANACK